jgi:hypothetical protein
MAQKHNLRVEVPFCLRFSDGAEITAEVRLVGYGADKGMLIVSDYSTIKDRAKEIVRMGYGYSCFSQPHEDEVDSDEELEEILEDWGKNPE